MGENSPGSGKRSSRAELLLSTDRLLAAIETLTSKTSLAERVERLISSAVPRFPCYDEKCECKDDLHGITEFKCYRCDEVEIHVWERVYPRPQCCGVAMCSEFVSYNKVDAFSPIYNNTEDELALTRDGVDGVFSWPRHDYQSSEGDSSRSETFDGPAPMTARDFHLLAQLNTEEPE